MVCVGINVERPFMMMVEGAWSCAKPKKEGP